MKPRFLYNLLAYIDIKFLMFFFYVLVDFMFIHNIAAL